MFSKASFTTLTCRKIRHIRFRIKQGPYTFLKNQLQGDLLHNNISINDNWVCFNITHLGYKRTEKIRKINDPSFHYKQTSYVRHSLLVSVQQRGGGGGGGYKTQTLEKTIL